MSVPLLLVASGHDDADWRYATGIDLEQGLYFDFGAEQALIVPELEYDRAVAQSKVKRVIDRRQAGWQESRDVTAALAKVASQYAREHGAHQVRVSARLPVGVYEGLRAAGLEVEIDRELFTARRRRKSPEEASFIHSAQRAAEAACAEVIAHLAVSEARDGWLWLDGRPLTSERLLARAESALAEIGYVGGEMIIAGSPECALPHYRGEGQIRAGAPVIIDIFPRGKTSGYHGDLTRTVVVGEVSEEVRRMHAACVQALEAAIAEIRPGVNGRDVHHTACRVLVEQGYGTYTKGYEGRADGPRMSHSLGHGVGLDVHEAPSLRDLDYPLEEGDVVTVEPGLYLPGLGGVRVEDTGLVARDSFKNFSSLPHSLDPRAYL